MTELSEPTKYLDFIRSCPVVLIHCWADWNGRDYQMKNWLKEIEGLYAGSVGFGAVDTELKAMHSILKEFKIINLPILAFYKDGILIETVVGLIQAQLIKEKLNLLLTNA